MGTTAEKLQAILDSKADIKDAIEAKGVTVGDAPLDEYASKIGEIQQGGGHVPSLDDDVRFFDYEGTLLYSYSKEDFAQLTELPENPSHEGLTAQGWNWTLADAKAYVAEHGMLEVGQNYTTSDGKTRLYISILDVLLTIKVNFYQSVSNGVTIDWGDGSNTETVSGTGNKSFTHTYSTAGDYVMSFDVTEGIMYFRYPLFDNSNHKYVLASYLKKAEIGNNLTQLPELVLGENNYFCYWVETISVPTTLTTFGRRFLAYSKIKFFVFPATASIGNEPFNNCRNLEGVSIPKDASISDTTKLVGNCYKITRITLPDSVNTIGVSFVASCYNLKRIHLPKVTSLGDYAFNNCTFDSIELPNTLTSFSQYCFYRAGIKSLTIPSGTENIPTYFIQEDSLLKEVHLPNTLKTIGSNAFGSTRLQKIVIPDSVTDIGASAFSGIFSLAEVVIGSGVTSIGNNAFSNCNNFMVVHVKPINPPSIGTTIFNGIKPDAKIYVPQGSLSAYQTATNWSAYASYMEEETT